MDLWCKGDAFVDEPILSLAYEAIICDLLAGSAEAHAFLAVSQGEHSKLCRLKAGGGKRQRGGASRIEMTVIDERPSVAGPSSTKTVTRSLVGTPLPTPPRLIGHLNVMLEPCQP